MPGLYNQSFFSGLVIGLRDPHGTGGDGGLVLSRRFSRGQRPVPSIFWKTASRPVGFQEGSVPLRWFSGRQRSVPSVFWRTSFRPIFLEDSVLSRRFSGGPVRPRRNFEDSVPSSCSVSCPSQVLGFRDKHSLFRPNGSTTLCTIPEARDPQREKIDCSRTAVHR